MSYGSLPLRSRAVRRRLPCRLERSHQARPRSAGDDGADLDRRGGRFGAAPAGRRPARPCVGRPAPAAWPWGVASVAIHLGYFAALIESYRAGDMGQVYPIARGSAPLLTATPTTLFLGERLRPPRPGGAHPLVPRG